MATTKSTKAKKSSKPAATKKTVSKTAPKTAKVETREEVATTAGNPLKGFFARKYDANENILTIFKSPRIYGAIIGEIVGTMLLTIILLTLGLYQPLYIMFGLIAITAAVYGLSGANLNPVITVGMMASRRMSAIRGVVYIISQILGAWFAFLVVNLFRGAGDNAAELPKVAEVDSAQFWVVTMIEFAAAIMIAFFFARALAYKKSPLTFAAIVGTGIGAVALVVMIVISSNFLSLQNNFVLNPAAALMYGIMPTGAENFGELLGGASLALVTYWIFPMLGGVIGFYLSDFAAKLSGECGHCGAKCICDGKARK